MSNNNNNSTTKNTKHSFYSEQSKATGRSDISPRIIFKKVWKIVKIITYILIIFFVIWGIVANASQYSNSVYPTKGLEYYTTRDDVPGNLNHGSMSYTYEHKGFKEQEYNDNGTYFYDYTPDLLPFSFWTINPNYGLHEDPDWNEDNYGDDVNTHDWIINVSEITTTTGTSSAETYSATISESDVSFRNDFLTTDYTNGNSTTYDEETNEYLWISPLPNTISPGLIYEDGVAIMDDEGNRINSWSRYFDYNGIFQTTPDGQPIDPENNSYVWRTTTSEDDDGNLEYEFTLDDAGYKSLDISNWKITPTTTDDSELDSNSSWQATPYLNTPYVGSQDSWDDLGDEGQIDYINTQMKRSMNDYSFIQGHYIDENTELILLDDNDERETVTFSMIYDDVMDHYGIQNYDPLEYSVNIEPIHEHNYHSNSEYYNNWLSTAFLTEENEGTKYLDSFSQGVEHGYTYQLHAETTDNLIVPERETIEFIIDLREEQVTSLGYDSWEDLETHSARWAGNDETTQNSGWAFLDSTNHELYELYYYGETDMSNYLVETNNDRGVDIEYTWALQKTSWQGYFVIEWNPDFWSNLDEDDVDQLRRTSIEEKIALLYSDNGPVSNWDDLTTYVWDFKVIDMKANDYRIESNRTISYGSSQAEEGTITYTIVTSATLKGMSYGFEDAAYGSNSSTSSYYVPPHKQIGSSQGYDWTYQIDPNTGDKVWYTTQNYYVIANDDLTTIANGKIPDGNTGERTDDGIAYSNKNSNSSTMLRAGGWSATNEDWVVFELSIQDWFRQWQLSGFHFFFVYPAAMLGTVINSIIPYYTFGGWGIIIGLIIVVFTLRFLGTLLTWGSAKSQSKMNEIQGDVASIKAKYNAKFDMKTDKRAKAKQSEEITALYKKHEVNPFGAMGQIFITLPIFLAIWTIVRTLPTYKIASIGPIIFGVSPLAGMFSGVGVIGITFYVLFIVAIGYIQFLSTRLPAWYADKRNGIKRLDEGTKAARKKQNKTQNIMVGVFVVIALILPLLIGLYWLISALYTIVFETIKHYFKTKEAKKIALLNQE